MKARFWKRSSGDADASCADPEATAAQILRAAAKARGEVVELPEPGSKARMILDADRKRRNEPPLGGKS
jgi:hypothetical protein